MKRLRSEPWQYLQDEVPLLCGLIILPAVTVVAALYVSHILLLLAYFFIAVSVFTVWLRPRGVAIEDHFFLILIGAVALSLLLSGTLLSRFISGYDIQHEFALFQQVEDSGVWNPQVSSLYNTALSVTILPVIISQVTSLNGTPVFQIIYPCLYAFTPMVLYRVYRKILAPKAAFLSVFGFLFYPSSYLEIAGLAREMVAALIFALLIFLMLSHKLRETGTRRVTVLILLCGLVIAHYSLALIFIGIISCSYILSKLFRFKFRQIRPLASGTIVCLSIVIALSLYFYVAGGVVLGQLSANMSTVIAGLSDFLSPASRPIVIVEALSPSQYLFGLHLLSRMVQYATIFLVLVGGIFFVLQKRKTKVARTMLFVMLPALVFLLASVILPNFAFSLNVSRIYSVALILIAPFFYFGANGIVATCQRVYSSLTAHRFHMRDRRLLLAAILFLYFIFTSGWVWAVTMDTPLSNVLDMERRANSSDSGIAAQFYDQYVVAEDVAAVGWLRSYGDARSVCADWITHQHVLTSYGGYPSIGPTLLNRSKYAYPPGCQFSQQYVLLSFLNSIWGIGISPDGTPFPINATVQTLSNENRIYSGITTVYDGFD